MTPVEIKVRRNGPYLVTGEVTLVDHEGRPIPVPTGKPNVVLCRCGHSAKKPFCDGTHRTCGFADPVDANPARDAAAGDSSAGSAGG